MEDEVDKRICELIMDSLTERQIAETIGMSQVAINKRKQKLKKLFEDKLKDF